jgi:hypothetical protein
MNDHPLFNNDPDDKERRSRNIDFININKWVGGKRVALPYQYEAEDLLTITDVFAVTGEGEFELVGRENDKKRVVDRVKVSLQAAPGTQPVNPPQPPPATAQPQPAGPQIPMMSVGNIQIPPGMDSNMVMMLVMLNAQQQQAVMQQNTMTAQMAAQREDSRNFMQVQNQLMLGLTQSTASMVTGLLQGIGSLIPRGSPGGTEGTADAFIKGIETMTELHAGIKEGNANGAPTDWNTVTTNIVTAVKGIRDVAAITNTAPAAPVVPAGAPAA